ncbi:LysR family transcriptional regulator [Tateyamaria omphalii]|uniref:Transcriptional regulator n=1 Tax=Tateyamaria omphalii TaxID=299262 RepID=A0A1P8MZN4_9RHOB|nr:LysR family transcriptional regulator [Tateyamaria omphalii]APX13493.1 transcriptional regulator [Tateyamaria omphalii]
MIDKLRAIAIFSTVVNQGSFRGAAQHLGLAPSRVSETVSNLEKDLDVTLLYRSTRQLSLTHEGRLLHERAQAMVAAAESGLDAINPSSKHPQGTLRITTPAFVTQTALMDDFAAFGERYPKIDLHFDFSDTPRDLIKDGYDVSIRAGWLEDSEFMVRSIGVADRLLVASADYVKQRGTPSGPSDLEAWNWIRFSVRPDQTLLAHPSGQEAVITGKSHLTVNSADALYEFAARGLGVTSIPEHLACRGFDRGELVHVLPDWSLRPLGLYAVWPDHSRRENLTTLFVRFLAGDG